MYFQSAGLITAEDVVYLATAMAVRTTKSASRSGNKLDLDSEFAMGELGSLRFRTHEQDEPAGRFQRAGVNLRNLHGRDDHGLTADYQGFGFQCAWRQSRLALQVWTRHRLSNSSTMFRICTAIMPSNSAEISAATLPTHPSLARRKVQSISGEAGALENFLAGIPTFATIQSGSPARNLSQWAYAASIQDDWRVTAETDGQSGTALRLRLAHGGSAQPTGWLRSQHWHGASRPSRSIRYITPTIRISGPGWGLPGICPARELP